MDNSRFTVVYKEEPTPLIQDTTTPWLFWYAPSWNSEIVDGQISPSRYWQVLAHSEVLSSLHVWESDLSILAIVYFIVYKLFTPLQLVSVNMLVNIASELVVKVKTNNQNMHFHTLIKCWLNRTSRTLLKILDSFALKCFN